MKGIGTAALVALLVVVISGGVFVVTPVLEGADSRNRSQADELVVKARRLLAGYNAVAGMAQSLTSGSDADFSTIDTDLLRKLVADNTRFVEQVDQVVGDLARAHDSSRQQVPDETRQFMQSLGFPDASIDEAFYVSAQTGKREKQWRRAAGVGPGRTATPMLRGLGGGPDQQARSLQQALSRIRAEYEASDGHLSESAATLQQAVGLVGDHIAANQMLASIEYQQALRRFFDALALRKSAERLRPGIIQRASKIRTYDSRIQSIAESREIEPAIDEAASSVAEFEDQIADQKASVSQLLTALAEKERRVGELEEAALDARRTYERAVAAEYDGTDSAAFVAHVRAIRERGADMIAAERALEAERGGTVHGVRAEPPGDFLRGQYVSESGDAEIEYTNGIGALKRELTTEQARLDTLMLARDDMRDRVEQLEQTRRTLEQDRSKAVEDLSVMRKALGERVEKADQLVAEAAEIENAAQNSLIEPAYRHARAAQRGQSSRISDAGRRKSQASPTASTPIQDGIQRERSWMNASLAALEGEIALLDATIRFHRAQDLRSHRRALADARRAGLRKIQLQDLDDELEDARYAALESAHAAAEKFNLAVRSDPQWVYQANLGVALRLLTQIDPTDDAFRQAAITTLRGCIQGREDQPTAIRLSSMLAALDPSGAAAGGDPSDDANNADDPTDGS